LDYEQLGGRLPLIKDFCTHNRSVRRQSKTYGPSCS
jgi:hypothetical protein